MKHKLKRLPKEHFMINKRYKNQKMFKPHALAMKIEVLDWDILATHDVTNATHMISWKDENWWSWMKQWRTCVNGMWNK